MVLLPGLKRALGRGAVKPRIMDTDGRVLQEEERKKDALAER
jgi:hypothetical protein